MIEIVKTPARRLRDLIADQWHRRTLGRLYSGDRGVADADLHLREAVQWLKRAQDAGADRGVSYGARFGERFLPSYPETTGYIIPTFLRLSRAFGDAELAERAVQAADWEVQVQMPSGAVMAGRVTETPRPAVFNTGQVLLGWAAVFETSAEARFKEAGLKAGEWLLTTQAPGGEFVRGNSPMADSDSTVYNVKAAWGLCRAGHVFDRQDFVGAAVRNAEFALRHQRENGWFDRCCLTDADRPLLHTLAYTLQGLVGIGSLTGRSDFIEAAGRTADALVRLMDGDGFIPGRIRADFTGAVGWCCMTGSAQTAIVWARLHDLTGDRRYREAYDRVVGYLLARHDVTSADEAIRGGVPGSWPVWGDYGRYMVLNWATKFFVDALLPERRSAPPFSGDDDVSG